MKYLFVILFFCNIVIAASFIQENGHVDGLSIKQPLSQRKWYENHSGQPKYIFINTGYHTYLNGFCHGGGISTKTVLPYKSSQYQLTKFQCTNFNGQGLDETFFFLKTKDRHYLKIAQCTKDKKVASLAYSIAYDYKDIKQSSDRVKKYCSILSNRKPLLFDSKNYKNIAISNIECHDLIGFVYNALSEDLWGEFKCTR